MSGGLFHNGGQIGLANVPQPDSASGLWLPNEVSQNIAAQRWPGTFGNDSFTKLLLKMPGADGSTTITDFSPSQRGNATVVGNAQVDTAQFKFGTGSLLLDGAGDALRYAAS